MNKMPARAVREARTCPSMPRPWPVAGRARWCSAGSAAKKPRRRPAQQREALRLMLNEACPTCAPKQVSVIPMRDTYCCDGLRGKGTRKPQPSPAYLVFFFRCAQGFCRPRIPLPHAGFGPLSARLTWPNTCIHVQEEWWRVGE